VLAKAAEAACRESDRDLLHVIMLLALTPNKVTPSAAVYWQPRGSHWLGPCLERMRAAAGCSIVHAERKLSELQDFAQEEAVDYLGVVAAAAELAGPKAGELTAQEKRDLETEELRGLVERKRLLLVALDFYLAAMHGGAATHPHQLRSQQSAHLDSQSASASLAGYGGASRDSRGDSPSWAASSSLGSTGRSQRASVDGILHARRRERGPAQASMDSPLSHGYSGRFPTGHQGGASSEGGGTAAESVTNAVEEVVRFDRRVPMRARARGAGDNPAWRAYVPQWTSEGGAHRVWKLKLTQRTNALQQFNALVREGAEKGPDLEDV